MLNTRIAPVISLLFYLTTSFLDDIPCLVSTYTTYIPFPIVEGIETCVSVPLHVECAKVEPERGVNLYGFYSDIRTNIQSLLMHDNLNRLDAVYSLHFKITEIIL